MGNNFCGLDTDILNVGCGGRGVCWVGSGVGGFSSKLAVGVERI